MRRAALLGAAVLVLTGCTAAGSTAPSPSPGLETLCTDARVVDCDVSDRSAVFTIGADVVDDDVIGFLQAAHALAAVQEHPSEVTLVGDAGGAPPPESDMSPPRRWTATAYPGDLTDGEHTLRGMLAVAAVPGTLGIADTSGWPAVDVADIARFTDIFHTVSALPLFADGGTYRLQAVENRLRIVHTPRWVSPAFVDAVIAIAAAHPDAEVLLEALAGGAEPPALYVSHLTPDEVSALATRLDVLDDVLADGADEGIRIPYTLGSLGSDGVTYTTGDVGSRRPIDAGRTPTADPSSPAG